MEKDKLIVLLGTTVFLLVPGVCGVALVGVGSFVNGIEVSRLGEMDDAPPIVTLAEFEQIQPSMSYREVAEVIGDPGIALDPQTELDGGNRNGETSGYIWKNSDASHMQATFQHDRLLTKSQLFLE